MLCGAVLLLLSCTIFSPVSFGLHVHVIVDDIVDFDFDNTNLFGKILIFVSELMWGVLNLGIFRVEVHIPLQRTLSHEMF